MNKKHWLLLSYLIYWVCLVGGLGYAVQSGYRDWPIKGQLSLIQAYQSLWLCVPLLFSATLGLIWVCLSGQRVVDSFQWKQFSPIFWVGLITSFGATALLYLQHDVDAGRWRFWPIILVFSLCNAYAEEVFYRLVFLLLILQSTKSKSLSVLIQSLAYALPHYWIGGTQLTLFAFFYGILLGYVYLKNESILPCILSHFVIDIGYIGLPFLLLP